MLLVKQNIIISKMLKTWLRNISMKKISQSRSENQTKGIFVSTNSLNDEESNSMHYQVLVIQLGRFFPERVTCTVLSTAKD